MFGRGRLSFTLSLPIYQTLRITVRFPSGSAGTSYGLPVGIAPEGFSSVHRNFPWLRPGGHGRPAEPDPFVNQGKILNGTDHGACANRKTTAVNHLHPLAPITDDVKEVADLLTLIKSQVGHHIHLLTGKVEVHQHFQQFHSLGRQAVHIEGRTDNKGPCLFQFFTNSKNPPLSICRMGRISASSPSSFFRSSRKYWVFLNVSHPNHPFGGQRTKTADPVDFFVDPKSQKSSKS